MTLWFYSDADAERQSTVMELCDCVFGKWEEKKKRKIFQGNLCYAIVQSWGEAIAIRMGVTKRKSELKIVWIHWMRGEEKTDWLVFPREGRQDVIQWNNAWILGDPPEPHSWSSFFARFDLEHAHMIFSPALPLLPSIIISVFFIGMSYTTSKSHWRSFCVWSLHVLFVPE